MIQDKINKNNLALPIYQILKEGVPLHSQKVIFREYFEYFLMR